MPLDPASACAEATYSPPTPTAPAFTATTIVVIIIVVVATRRPPRAADIEITAAVTRSIAPTETRVHGCRAKHL
jgi:hypothetical protein